VPADKGAKWIRGRKDRKDHCLRLEEKPEMPPNEKVLVIMASGARRSQLSACLKALGLQPTEVEDCRHAGRALARRSPLKLVISDVDFRDGDWRDALAAAQQRPGGVSFLVSTPFPDHGMWSEALWRGVHDLLVEPYSASELRRIVEGALRAQECNATPLRAMVAIAEAG
jgi:DNA-binding NtrC family response regulator